MGIRVAVLVVVLVLGACSNAPVQEMSDARQALHAAKKVGAERRSPVVFSQARRYLLNAQTALQRGEYTQARYSAIRAKKHAVMAQRISVEFP